mgnify:CR=1 FL=1
MENGSALVLQILDIRCESWRCLIINAAIASCPYNFIQRESELIYRFENLFLIIIQVLSALIH